MGQGGKSQAFSDNKTISRLNFPKEKNNISATQNHVENSCSNETKI